MSRIHRLSGKTNTEVQPPVPERSRPLSKPSALVLNLRRAPLASAQWTKTRSLVAPGSESAIFGLRGR